MRSKRTLRAAPAARHKREKGSALLVAMMIMSLMAIMALSSLDMVMRDRQVAGFQSRSRTALYAAEAAIASATGVIRQDMPSSELGLNAMVDWRPDFPEQGVDEEVLGDGGARAPVFYSDPTALDSGGDPQPIRYMGAGDPCWNNNTAGAMSINVGGGNPQYRDALFDVRVEGNVPGGSPSRIQAVVTKCHPY